MIRVTCPFTVAQEGELPSLTVPAKPQKRGIREGCSCLKENQTEELLPEGENNAGNPK